ERTAGDAAPEAEVGARAMGEVQPEVGVHVADESGAVETAGGRVAAPAVRDAEEAAGGAHRPDAEGLRRSQSGNVRAVEPRPGWLQAREAVRAIRAREGVSRPEERAVREREHER